MRKTTSRCLALLIAIVSFGLPLVVQAQRKPNATRILNNVSRAYSRLASYQDEGILVLTSEEATGGRIEKMPFKAYFKRPKLFRFEWTAQGRFDTHVFIATHGKLGQLVCMAGYTDVPKSYWSLTM